MKLYEYPQSILNIMELLESEDFSQSDEVKNALDTLEMGLKQKAENIAHKINELTGDVFVITTELQRLNNIKKQKEAQAEWLKNYIKSNIEALAEPEKGYRLETSLFKFTLSKPSYNKLVLDDNFNIEDLPEEFVTTEVKQKPDAKAIKEALKRGEHLDGCMLIESRSFTIK